MFGRIAMILLGIGMILFATTCFKEVPLIGTVFLLPGDNILKAKLADPVWRDALYLIGGMFAAYGIHLQIRIGFSAPLNESNEDAAPGADAKR